jgi:hypothetical protein
MADEKVIKPWWLFGMSCVYAVLILSYLVPFLHEDNFLFIVPLIMVGTLGLISFFNFVREFFRQHAQYSIRSILILTLCTAILCSAYSCIGLGYLLVVYSGMYFNVVIIWYWKYVQ